VLSKPIVASPRPKSAANANTKPRTSIFRIVSGACPAYETKQRRAHNAAHNLEGEGVKQLVAMGNLEKLCGGSTLPTAAESQVDLDQCNKLVGLRLRQP
jgi:hypothetical protein